MSRHDGLPNGWATGTICDLVSPAGLFCDGDWIESKDQDPNGDVRLIQLADIGDGDYVNKSNRFLTKTTAVGLRCTFLQNSDVLIARMPDPLGRACIFPGDQKEAITAVDVCIVRSGSRFVEQRWLMWFINTPDVRARVAALQSGSTRKRISRKNLATISLPIPPAPEQRRIVAKIEELFSDLDAGVAALERAKANLKRYRAAVLKSAVEGKLTAQWRAEHPDVEPASELLNRILRERRQKWEDDQLAKYEARGKKPPKGWKEKYKEPVGPDTSKLPQLPEGWCWVTVEQVGLVQLGRQRSPKNRSKDYPTKYIRAANITERGLDLSDVMDMDFKPNELATYRLRRGDIVLSEASGSADQAGKPAVWNAELPVCCFQNTVIRFRPNSIGSAYPITVFKHFYVNKVFAKVAGGVGINHLSAAKFSKIPLPLPPIREQEQIVADVERLLAATDHSLGLLEIQLCRSIRLRQSILKRAFEGKLVPQDPNDEPAAVLLEQIQAERAELKSAKTKRQSPRRHSGRSKQVQRQLALED